MRGRDDTFIRIATHAIYDLNIDILTSYEWMGDIRKADYTAYFFALVPSHVHTEVGKRWLALYAP